MPDLLDAIEMETGKDPTASIIWLHGLGADGNDFAPIVPELRLPKAAIRFVFPHAPVQPVTINGGMRMRAWYDIVSLERRTVEDEAGFRDTDLKVRELISREIQRGIPAHRIVLAGFSQGGAASLYTAPRLAERLAGVMSLSAYLPLAGRLAAERDPANLATPIFMAHGLADATLPIKMALDSREQLTSLGYTIEWHQYPMAHGLCSQEIADIRHYLFRVLPPL